MRTPAISPEKTDPKIPSDMNSILTRAKRAINIRIEEPRVPVSRDRRRPLMLAFSLVRTIKIPITESKIPMAATIIGAITYLNPPGRAAPRAAVARIDPQ